MLRPNKIPMSCLLPAMTSKLFNHTKNPAGGLPWDPLLVATAGSRHSRLEKDRTNRSSSPGVLASAARPPHSPRHVVFLTSGLLPPAGSPALTLCVLTGDNARHHRPPPAAAHQQGLCPRRTLPTHSEPWVRSSPPIRSFSAGDRSQVPFPNQTGLSQLSAGSCLYSEHPRST